MNPADLLRQGISLQLVAKYSKSDYLAQTKTILRQIDIAGDISRLHEQTTLLDREIAAWRKGRLLPLHRSLSRIRPYESPEGLSCSN
jgi:hypothetical protein